MALRLATIRFTNVNKPNDVDCTIADVSDYKNGDVVLAHIDDIDGVAVVDLAEGGFMHCARDEYEEVK